MAALRRDPTHPVRTTVQGMTVELRAVESGSGEARSLADALRELSPWEGETHDELVAIFGNIRQRSVRPVPSFDE